MSDSSRSITDGSSFKLVIAPAYFFHLTLYVCHHFLSLNTVCWECSQNRILIFCCYLNHIIE